MFRIRKFFSMFFFNSIVKLKISLDLILMIRNSLESCLLGLFSINFIIKVIRFIIKLIRDVNIIIRITNFFNHCVTRVILIKYKFSKIKS